MSFTSTLKDNILNHVFRNEPYTSPTSVYVALFTSTNNEVDAEGYERQEVTFNAPTNNEISNDNEVRFNLATEDWGTITHAILFDNSTNGNRLNDATSAEGRLVRENDQFIIPAGGYKVRLRSD